MLSFDEKEELKMEQDAFDLALAERVEAERGSQIVAVTAKEYARAAQHRALLVALRTVVQTDSYAVERVANAVVAAFDELEGTKC